MRFELSALIQSLRPREWTKNATLLFGLVFAVKFTDLTSTRRAIVAAGLFCLLSSSIYLINDVLDIEKDRQHPKKRFRPIPAGRLSKGIALVVAATLCVVAVFGATLLSPGFTALAAGYYVLMVAYAIWLKHLVLLDVFTIAAGFLIRVVAGAVAIDVPISSWLYVCTSLGALFLGFEKRRHELATLAENADRSRPILAEYSLPMLDQIISVIAASTLIAYCLYTITADNLPKNGSMLLTAPFVAYGLFRYLYLVHRRGLGGGPADALIDDRPLLANVLLWLVASGAILYFGLERP